MSCQPFAITGCCTQNGKEANACRWRKHIEGRGNRYRKPGKRSRRDEPTRQAEQSNAGDDSRGRQDRAEQQFPTACLEEEMQDRFDILEKKGHSAASRRVSLSRRVVRCMRAASSGSCVATISVRSSARASRLAVISTAV